MPRRLLKKLCPAPSALQQRWFLRLFGDRIADPRLWALHRRAVTCAFGAGLAICFIPLPVHMLVAGVIAVAWRLNIPAIYGTILLVNPLTAVPVYYLAYRYLRGRVDGIVVEMEKHAIRMADAVEAARGRERSPAAAA